MAPCELPISKELQERLLKWAAIYDETLDVDYPPNSGFKSEELEREFKSEGERLVISLRNELGQNFLYLLKFSWCKRLRGSSWFWWETHS
ncbi:hypothetical protein [Pseudomonas sp. FEN]|nr:hypothetical protein [Pseudomonas sp. FEN]